MACKFFSRYPSLIHRCAGMPHALVNMCYVFALTRKVCEMCADFREKMAKKNIWKLCYFHLTVQISCTFISLYSVYGDGDYCPTFFAFLPWTYFLWLTLTNYFYMIYKNQKYILK